MKYLVLIFLLAGCAQSVDLQRLRQDYQKFEADCYFEGGVIYRPKQRRVHNAPPTPWEMHDAVCHYSDMHPRRMYP